MATKREWDSVIGHWKRLSTGKRRKHENIGSDDCAFCRRYAKDYNDCNGCPVFEETSIISCIGTPYDDVERHYHESLWDESLDDPEFKRLAKKELEFLLKIRKKVRGD